MTKKEPHIVAVAIRKVLSQRLLPYGVKQDFEAIAQAIEEEDTKRWAPVLKKEK